MSILNINKGLIETKSLDTEELYITTVSSTYIVWILTSVPFGFDFTLICYNFQDQNFSNTNSNVIAGMIVDV
uniref:Uncharacterized protein n=1 Tax=Pithovirus LCDPAC02 TaxID=2506601 RepID=A0A481YPD2_9VIRU|nr:MAG: hypothetical protein LCDPAC02_03110 [Pithovirus LCDPAC02]